MQNQSSDQETHLLSKAGAQDDKVYRGKISELWTYATLRINLIALVVCYCTCSMGYYVLAYALKNLNGTIFANGYASAAGEISGKLSAIPLLKYNSLRKVFLIAFGMSALSFALLIVFLESDTMTPILIMINRFFVSQGYVFCYLGIVLLYPTILASTAGGICVLMSKGITIVAPMIAEIQPPINFVIVLIATIAAIIASYFIREEENEQ